MTGGRGSPRAGRMMVSSQMSTPEWRSSAALYVRIRTNKEFWSRAAFRLRPTSRYSSRPAQYFNWKKWENGQKGRSGQTLGSGRLECLGRGSYRPRGAMIPTSARRPPADTAGRRWRTWRWRQPHQAWGIAANLRKSRRCLQVVGMRVGNTSHSKDNQSRQRFVGKSSGWRARL